MMAIVAIKLSALIVSAKNPEHNQSQINLKKRSLTIAGHRTSIALEPQFWAGLEDLASSRGLGLPALIADIDQHRQDANLTSTLRLKVLEHYQLRMTAS